MRNLADSFDIHDIQTRIANHLAKDQLGVRPYCRFNRIWISCRYKGGFNAKPRQCVFQQIDIRPIKLGRRDNMIAS